MERLLIARILVLVLLVSAFFSARTSGGWYCEGRRCGVTPWSCCCTDPTPYQHGECRKPHQSGAGTSMNLCSAACSCVLVMSGASDMDRSTPPAAASPTPPLLAVMPAPLSLYVPPPLAETVAYRVDARGPPPGGRSFATPSLRAPPAA